MPNRYQNDPRFTPTTYNGQSADSYRLQSAKAARDQAWARSASMLGSVAGLAGGTALGFATGDPMAGAGLGLKAGSAMGQMASAPFNAESDEDQDPMRADQIRRMALMQAMSNMRGR